jgi:3-oxoacyl-[acyl-carrier-protein] synthase-3
LFITMPRPVVIGTGICIPEKILTNFDLEKMVETTNEWIVTRTGIQERHLVENGICTSDMGAEAGKRALEKAGLQPDELDLIMVGTMTPDNLFPSSACVIQEKLNAKNAAAFDVSAACSGFLFILSIAEQYIKTDAFQNILVVGAETMSRFVDWEDRSTCVIFGDGAGAVVLQARNENSRGIIATKLFTDGSYRDMLYLPAGGSRLPASRKSIENNDHYLKMRGNELFKIAVRALTDSCRTILQENNMVLDDVALFIPHQANIRIIKAVANQLGLPMDKVFSNIDRYGNTSASSIPIALDEAARSGRLKEGDLVLLAAFGSGLTWASTLLRW